MGIDLASLNSRRLTDRPTNGRTDGNSSRRRRPCRWTGRGGAPGCPWPSRFMARCRWRRGTPAGAGATTRTRTNPHGASGGSRGRSGCTPSLYEHLPSIPIRDGGDKAVTLRACTPLQCLSCGHCPRGRSARVSLTHTFAASMTDAQQPGPGRRELAGRKTHQIPRHFFITSAADGAVRAGRSVQVQIRFRDEERTAPQGPARPCTYGTRFGTGTACGKGRGNRRACALPRSIGTPAAASLFDDVHRGRGYRRLLGPHRRAGPVRREAARGSRSPSDARRRRRGAECVGDGPGERPRRAAHASGRSDPGACLDPVASGGSRS